MGCVVAPLVFLMVAIARSGEGGQLDERGGGGGGGGDVINAVRCRVRCLSLMQVIHFYTRSFDQFKKIIYFIVCVCRIDKP